MTKTRAVAITALVAASAMVLAGCGNIDQAGTTTPPAATSDAATSGNGAVSSDTGAPSATGSGGGAGSGTATASGSTPGGGGDDTACGKPHGAWAAPASTGGSVNVSFNEGITSWNGANGHSNSSYNTYPANLTQANIQYYDDQLVLNNNDTFVTCKKVDDSTFSYTVNKPPSGPTASR